MKKNKTYLNARVKGILHTNIKQNRRDTVYKMISKQNDGSVPCFVCHRHVDKKNATLEHVLPISKYGTDDMDNLSISHTQCNQRRGNLDVQ
jgi:5-methylcytosine-specific restriction endonuclease McrA